MTRSKWKRIIGTRKAKSGREFTLASIWARTIFSSSRKVSVLAPTTLLRWCLVDTLQPPKNPPKFGEWGGMMCQFVPFVTIQAEMSEATPDLSWVNNALNFLLAPTKVVPLSLHISLQWLRLDVQRLSSAMNACYVMSLFSNLLMDSRVAMQLN